MNKYVLAMVVLGFLGFHGFKRLKDSYQLPFESGPNIQTSNKVAPYAKDLESGPLEAPADRPAEIIYYLNVDRFADGDQENNEDVQKTNPLGFHGGDLQGVIQNLDHIDSLGATAILLDPLTLQNTEPRNFKDKSGSQYNHFPFSGFYQDDPSKIDPRFGTLDQLMELSKKAKAKGIKLFMLLDLRFVMPGSPLVKDPKTASYFLPKDIPICRPKEKIMRDCSYGGRRTFDQKNQETVNFLIEQVSKTWARYGLDGIFLKWASLYEPSFVISLRKELKAKFGQNFKVVAQSLLKEGAFHGSKVTDYRYHSGLPDGIMNLIYGDIQSDVMVRYLQKAFFPQRGQLNVAAIKNDFRPSLPYMFSDQVDIYPTSIALIIASGGSPIIHFGEEVGKIDAGMPLYKTDFPWGSKMTAPGAGLTQNKNILAQYKALFELRKKSPGLFEGAVSMISSEFPKQAFCFEMMDKEKINSLSCFNFSGRPVSIEVRSPKYWEGKSSLKDRLGGKSLKVDEGKLTVSLPEFGAAILAP